jgi:cell division protein ZapE
MAGLLAEYERRRAAGELRPDAAQLPVLQRLEALATALEGVPKQGGLRRMLRKAPEVPKGLYIHGAVGRGKSMVMDLFFGQVQGLRKRRVHFHAFMQDVHKRLHATRQLPAKEAPVKDVLAPVAKAIASEARLLCLDEMQITDIADAMIVGRLFEGLLAAGTVIVTTSNLAPQQLYRDGLNRHLFLPFIRLMVEKLEVISLDSATDYRMGRVKAHETFLTPLNPETDGKLQDLWTRLTDTQAGEAIDIDVLGRKLHVPQAAHGCARFSFAELCEKPLGPPDYLALAHHFGTLFVEHIPALGPERRNEAKRFVMLIDTLYDAGVRFVASSSEPAEAIYPAGDHAFEFGRTVSRLKEMQSASWWGKTIVET